MAANLSPDRSRTPSELLQQNRDAVLQIAARHGAHKVRLFGSIARGDQRPDSDIDILVEMEEDRNLLDLIGLWQDLTDLLDWKVDVLSDGGISPYLRERIYAEAVPL